MPDVTERDAREAYDALRGALRPLQLGWVIEQVEATVALGKPQRRRLRREDVPEPAWRWVSPEASTRRRGAPAVFVVADEYTIAERLALLVEAIRASVIQPVNFAEAVLASLPEGVMEAGVQFRPELESGGGFVLDGSVIRNQREAVALLAALLDELTPDDHDAIPTRITF